MKTINDINTELPEGRLLLMALGQLMMVHSKKTPDELLDMLQEITDKVYEDRPLNGITGYMIGVTKALKEDPDYFRGWRDNISIAFQDAFSRVSEGTFGDSIDAVNRALIENIKHIADKAAENFLNLLIR